MGSRVQVAMRGNLKSHWNVISMVIPWEWECRSLRSHVWLLRRMGIKQRKRFINVYIRNYR